MTLHKQVKRDFLKSIKLQVGDKELSTSHVFSIILLALPFLTFLSRVSAKKNI